MRELKFRAWFQKHWYHDGMLYDWQDNQGVDSCCGFQPEGVVVMQYTGLKDCKGKEIYEGDILKFHGKKYQVEPYEAYAKTGLTDEGFELLFTDPGRRNLFIVKFPWGGWEACRNLEDYNSSMDFSTFDEVPLVLGSVFCKGGDSIIDYWEVIGNVHEHKELLDGH